MEKLALHGGTPVRTAPFPPQMPGASLLGSEELKEITDVIFEKSPFRFYGIGQPGKAAAFEAEVRQRLGVRYALGVSSGSAALLCAVAALGLGPGDEVIIPSFSWYSDYCALLPFGITPVFADIGDDLNLDPADVERKITPRTRAVIIVSYQGCPAQMDALLDVAERRGLLVIEDCAQAFGGSYRGRRLGTMGDVAIASFQTHKTLTSGEGGLFFTNNEDYFVRAVRYHDLGAVRPFFLDQLSDPEKAAPAGRFPGLQLRMSELQAACLLGQIRKLDTILGTCRAHHARLRRHMERYPEISVRYEDGDCGIAFIMLMPTESDAERFARAMQAEGIPCGPTSACSNLMRDQFIQEKAMVHPLLPPFGPGCPGEGAVYNADTDCTHTDSILSRFVAIGIGPLFTDGDIDDIIRAVDKVLAAK